MNKVKRGIDDASGMAAQYTLFKERDRKKKKKRKENMIPKIEKCKPVTEDKMYTFDSSRA